MADVNAEQERSRAEIADYLREFADKLDTRSVGETGTTGTGTETGIEAGGTDAVDADEGAGTGGSSPPETDRSRMGEPGSTSDAGTDRDRIDETDVDAGARTTEGKMTVIVGNESATINPPETVRFGVAVDTDSSLLSAGNERQVTFTLSWSEEHVESDDELDVE